MEWWTLFDYIAAFAFGYLLGALWAKFTMIDAYREGNPSEDF